MKAKSKTGGGIITVKKPTSAREKPSLRNNIKKSPTQTNPKKDAPKKDNLFIFYLNFSIEFFDYS